MLDKLSKLFKEGLEYTHTSGVLQQVANLVSIVNAQYMKDETSKNVAIDTICDILKTHKDAPAPCVMAAPTPIKGA